MPPPRFGEITDKWWDSIPKAPSKEDIALIVRFSGWVLKKQPQRGSLIRRVLSLDQEGSLRLHANEATSLAEPYAGRFRRIFFSSYPTIAPVYETEGAEASRAEWRAFFESLDPPPAGKFSLSLTAKMMSHYELMEHLPKDYKLPTRRSSWMTTERRGFEVRSDYFTVIDAALPSVLTGLLKSTVTLDQFSAISEWLSESPAQLHDHASVEILYIAYNSSWVASKFLPIPAEWVASLTNTAWVYTKTAEGPFEPCDVLPIEDPVRPNARVADLPNDLIGALQSCGIAFGNALPNAPATDRLRIQGPYATPEQLFEFLQGAITEAGDDPTRQEFVSSVLLQRNLFPVPAGGAIDGATRVPLGRIVRNGRGRSLLGNWLISIDSFSEESAERKVLELADSFLPVAETASFSQVVDFLSWVWSTAPDAELVRRFLPRAYAYAREDIEIDRSLKEQWEGVLPNVRVFVQGKRQWVSVVGANDLFFDDLNDSALRTVLSSIDIATPGHFGESQFDQVGVANLLGITLLSSRFRVAVGPEGAQTIPGRWQANFGTIQNWLRDRLQNEQETDAGGRGVPPENLKLSRWLTLRTVVQDSGTPVQTSQVMAAALKDGTIAVSCTPYEFAEELCRVLFTQWGLRLRRDLVELLPKVAIQLSRIDDEAFMLEFHSKTVPVEVDQSQSSPDGQPVVLLTSTIEEVPRASDQPINTAENVGGASEQTPDEIILKGEPSNEVAPGGSYTQDTREARIRAWIDKRTELDRKISKALAVDILPGEEAEEQRTTPGEFRADDPYRQAALKYESENHRHASVKSTTQSGHDIDSYTHPQGHPERKLIRRIEVKGRSTPWDLDEIVEMSETQFKDALNVSVPDGEQIDSDFDYWLYVVERRENGELNILPIRNVAKQATRFGLKGGSWRHEAEPKPSKFHASQEDETESNA